MNTITATIFNSKYDLKIEYQRNENGNILKSQLEILEMFISYVLYDYLNTSNLMAIRDPNYVRPKSEMVKLQEMIEERDLKEYKPSQIYIHLPKSKNRVELIFINENNDSFNAIFENNRFIEII